MPEMIAPLIAGNWKMNGGAAMAAAFATELLRLCGPESAGDRPPALVVCPPATLISELARRFAGSAIALGGQDCHAEDDGAHTGDVSAAQLADAGARCVILGHSERRRDHGETSAQVAAKTHAAGRQRLTPIICVGETLDEHRAGATLRIISEQLRGSIPEDFADDFVVAYEPVWAIGTGLVPTADQIAEVHGLTRAVLIDQCRRGAAAPILYGGSVKPDNAGAILAIAGVGGALVGGASLSATEFWTIAASAR